MSRTAGAGFDWARRFDDDAAEALISDPAALVRLTDHDDFTLAAPTPALPTPVAKPVLMLAATPQAPTRQTLLPNRSSRMLHRGACPR